MPRRAEIVVAVTTTLLQFSGGGTNYLVQTPAGVLYFVFVANASAIAFKKSTNGGLTWSPSITIYAGTTVAFSVWYDKWSGLAGGLIHIAYTGSGASGTLYRTINTESSDALSTQTTIFAGASSAAGGMLSITRARGGNVYCRTTIDAGVEGRFCRLLNADVPNGVWDTGRTLNEANATQDMILLAPGFASEDDQDIMAIFWDISESQISRQIYNDSLDSWDESIFGAPDTFIPQVAATSFPHFALAVDLTNSQLVVIAWNGIDTANADLTCWTVNEAGIIAQTNVVLNGVDDQALAAICIDLQTGYWTAFYAGKSDGSETFPFDVNLYYKVSTDSGSTWGAETLVTFRVRNTAWMTTVPRLYLGQSLVVFHDNITYDELCINIDIMQPRTNLNIGI